MNVVMKKVSETKRLILSKLKPYLTEAHITLKYFYNKKKPELNALKNKFFNLLKRTKEKIIWYKYYLLFRFIRLVFILPKYLSDRILYAEPTNLIYIITLIYASVFCVISIFLFREFDIVIGIDDAQELFIGAGAMVGGSLAIVTTFAQFTIQNAADKYPKDFYKIAADIRKYIVIFFVSAAISLFFFLTAFYYGRLGFGLSYLALPLLVYLLGSAFYLLFLLLYCVKQDVDANNILKRISKETHKTLSFLDKRTVGYARVLQVHPYNRTNTVDELVAGLSLTPAFRFQLDNLNIRISYLFDYHDALLARKEKSSAEEILRLINSLVRHYLKIRKSSSILLPVPESVFVFTSDSRTVMQTILERMNRLSLDYVKLNDAEGLMKIVGSYIGWLKAATEIKYIGMKGNENPIVEQISGNFTQFMKTVMKFTSLDSLEGLFQGLRFYEEASALAIEKTYYYELPAYLDMVEEIAYKGILIRQEPVIQRAFDIYTVLVGSMAKSKRFSSETMLSSIMKHIQNITYYTWIPTRRGTLRDTLLVQQAIAKPYRKLEELIVENDNVETEITELAELLYRPMRYLADETENPNHFLVLSFGQIIKSVGLKLVTLAADTEKEQERAMYLLEALSYVNLPGFFIPDEGKIEGNQSFDSLIEAVGAISLEALSNNFDDVATGGLKVLIRNANKMLNRKEKGKDAMYVEPYIMGFACYLGVLALKQGKTIIYGVVKSAISEYEDLYKTKYYSDLPPEYDIYSISPPADKLKKDLERLVEERGNRFSNRLPLADSFRDHLFRIISIEDIRKFISAVWQY